ncbi:MAG: putative membrane protein [Arenicella sp.]
MFGISVFVKPKGTRLHKCLGRLYLLSMLGLIISSFSLFEIFGTFGIFHFASLVSLWCISMGFRGDNAPPER